MSLLQMNSVMSLPRLFHSPKQLLFTDVMSKTSSLRAISQLSMSSMSRCSSMSFSSRSLNSQMSAKSNLSSSTISTERGFLQKLRDSQNTNTPMIRQPKLPVIKITSSPLSTDLESDDSDRGLLSPHLSPIPGLTDVPEVYVEM